MRFPLFIAAFSAFCFSAALAAPTQVTGAKCTTVRLDDYGTLSVQAGSKTVTLNTPFNFKCGTLTVSDDGKNLKVTGKTLAETLSIFKGNSTFGQVWGLYIIDFRKPGLLSIVDSSDGTVPTKTDLSSMKDTIGDASATYSQPGVSGWVFKGAQSQIAKYNVAKPVTVTFKDSASTTPYSSITLDAKKATITAKHNAN